jgi:pimeloyl-ACP methyl ester carboxylesterase
MELRHATFAPRLVHPHPHACPAPRPARRALARAETPVGATPSPTGTLVEVSGRLLFLSCQSVGSPTVILEAGLNDGAAVWSAVQGEVAKTTRVCSYDRASVPSGASDPDLSPGLRPAATLVADLHALLTEASIPGPYVLVGHSIGSLIARLYASTYPDELVGMVLVDATHEDNFARLEKVVGPDLWAAFIGQFEQAVEQGVLEPVDLADLAARVKAAQSATPLPQMPLVVLSHTVPPAAGPLPNWPVAAEERLWQELQDDLVGLVPNSRHVVAEQSGHYIHQSEPDLVVEAIRAVVEAVRDPDTWATPAATPVT